MPLSAGLGQSMRSVHICVCNSRLHAPRRTHATTPPIVDRDYGQRGCAPPLRRILACDGYVRTQRLLNLLLTSRRRVVTRVTSLPTSHTTGLCRQSVRHGINALLNVILSLDTAPEGNQGVSGYGQCT